MTNKIQGLSAIPSVDGLLAMDAGHELVARYGRPLVLDALRQAIDATRQSLLAEVDTAATQGRTAIVRRIVEQAQVALEAIMSPSLKPVLNLSGTVLHTNLGRAPLPEACIERIANVARGASNLEYDLAHGRRGDRDDHVERWLTRLTGAQAATVVNNNAAAVLLTLNSLALNQPVAVSRGELVEIGGSFRVPEVMTRAGCQLMEVGTTNRTHLKDYKLAASNGAVAFMKVHCSNYEIKGFTATVDESELAALSADLGLVSISDLGSGCLVDLSAFGLPRERTVAEVVATGVDVVTFSGDKLLGGPQCGVIAGSAAIVDRIKKNPMKRALRCDKLTLAALEAILGLYADPSKLSQEVPALGLLCRGVDDIRAQATRIAASVAAAVAPAFRVDVVDCASQIGSGAVPVETLASVALKISPLGSGGAVNRLAAALRALPTPVLGRVSDGGLLLDLRCLGDDASLLDGLRDLRLQDV